MKKIKSLTLFSTIFFSFFMLIFFSHPAQAGMTLTEGEFVVMGTDPSAEDFFNQQMFRDTVLEIDQQGKVKGKAESTFSDVERKGALFNGTATLNMDGTYDAETTQLNGTFSVKHESSMKDEQEKPLVSFYNTDNMTFAGTFSGGWSVEGGLEIIFTGAKSSVGKTENSNGNVDEYDKTTKWTNKAIFKQDLCASLIAKAEKQNSWTLFPVALAKDSGARFTDFSGEVLVAPKGNVNDEGPAEREMVLQEGDTITTGGDSCAVISFGDMSTFVMKARSKVILASAPEKLSKLQLLAGNIWVNLKHIAETGQLDVTMNQAIAGTKGTIFVAEETGTLSTIKVIEGLMGYKVLATGEEFDVAPGEMASADEKGLVEKTTFDAEKESAMWDKIQNNLAFVGAGKIVKPSNIDSPQAENQETANQTVSSETEKSKRTMFIVATIIFVSLIILSLLIRKKK